MAYQSEIEKLKRRYEEKPSQWFAALAEEYRRAGEIEHALDIVRKGLEERSNYVSGHIVYARCLQDHGDDPSAVEVLGKVLELDSENVIALKGLADIAERSEKPSESREWLRRLLEVDPMNDEAREMMERLQGAQDTAEASPGAEDQDEAATFEAAAAELAAADVETPAPPRAPSGPVEAALAEVDAAEAAPEQSDDPARVGEVSLGGGQAPADAPLEATAPRRVASSPPDAMVPPDPVRVQEATQPAAPPAVSDAPPAPAASGDVEILESLPFEPAAKMDGVAQPAAAPEEAGEPGQPVVIGDVEPSYVPPVTDADEPSPGVVGASVEKDEPVELVPGTAREGVVRAEVERPGDVELTSAQGAEEVDHSTSLESRIGDETAEGPVVGATVSQDEPIELRAADVPAGLNHANELGAGVGELEPEPPPIDVPAEPAPPPVSEREPEPVVTETMAEVYVRQGLLEEARRVYRQLLAQRPDDAGLKARLAELVEVPKPPPVAEPAAPQPAAAPVAPEPPSRPSFHAADTGGRSTRDFFAQLLTETHAGPSSGGQLQTAVPPSSDGHSGSGGDNALAGAFGSSAPAAGGQPGGMSFDSFFDESNPDQSAGGGAPPGPNAAEEGDFKNWLKGLKS